jgi:hypothetical protein
MSLFYTKTNAFVISAGDSNKKNETKENLD